MTLAEPRGRFRELHARAGVFVLPKPLGRRLGPAARRGRRGGAGHDRLPGLAGQAGEPARAM